VATYVDVIKAASWTWQSFAPNPAMQAIFTKAYSNIAPELLGVSNREGIAFPQALFLIAQSLIEQSATVQDPAGSSYRIFNMQLHDDEKATFSAADQAAMEKKKVQVKGVPGVFIKKIPSKEILKGKPQVLPSPFFVFDSMNHSVNHFLRRLSGDPQYFLTLSTTKMANLRTGYAAAFKVLQDPKKQVDDYTKALQAAGYASAGPQYVTDIHNRYRTVVNDFIQMIGMQLAGPRQQIIDMEQPGPRQASLDVSLLDTMKAQAQAALKATPPVP
jgi:hypothetical protein